MPDNHDAAACLKYLEELITYEINQPSPDVAKISIAVGAVEVPLTLKKGPQLIAGWPTDLEQQVSEQYQAFRDYVDSLHASQQLDQLDARLKVKAISDAVWKKLKGFSKDVLHSQHVFKFARILTAPDKLTNRQLDCAGVTTTTYAICRVLASEYGHEDLEPIIMQVSEDHCWLNLDGSGQRESAVEVTTDNVAKRGLAPTEEAWQGWLYAAGHAVRCDPHTVVTALVASLDPQISPGKNGEDSEHVQLVLYRGLRIIRSIRPGNMYPAATCALADCIEIEDQDALDEMLETRSVQGIKEALVRMEGPEGAHALFREAVEAAVQGGQPSAAASLNLNLTNGSVDADGSSIEIIGGGENGNAAEQSLEESNIRDGGGNYWYPYSYLANFLFRRAEFLSKCGDTFPEDKSEFSAQALSVFKEAFQVCVDGSSVLAKYRYTATDEQIFKDLEGVLENCTKGLTEYIKRHTVASDENKNEAQAQLLVPLFTLWDGICALYTGRSKPGGLLNMVLSTLRLFTPEARQQAAAATSYRSGPMQQAGHLWGPLKPSVLRPLFETADIPLEEDGERMIKKRRV